MTIWDLHCKDNEGDSEWVDLATYVGMRVRHKVYGKDGVGDTWSSSVHTIESFDDDVCGDGCCNGYTIDNSGMSWRSVQLLVESE